MQIVNSKELEEIIHPVKFKGPEEITQPVNFKVPEVLLDFLAKSEEELRTLKSQFTAAQVNIL